MHDIWLVSKMYIPKLFYQEEISIGTIPKTLQNISREVHEPYIDYFFDQATWSCLRLKTHCILFGPFATPG